MTKRLVLLVVALCLSAGAAYGHGPGGIELPNSCSQYAVFGRVASGTGVLSCEAAAGTGSIVRSSTLSSYVPYTAALCDDSTDDRATIQAEIDAFTAASGGTIFLPPDTGRKCIIGSPGLTMKSTVRIEGFGSGVLKAKSDIADQIIDATTANNWTINGVRFELNSVAQGAIDVSGINWQFTNNTVTGSPTTSQSEWNILKLGCTTSSYGQCLIQGNRVTGSGTAATNDNCLLITGGGAGFTGQGFPIVDNDFNGCGLDGIVGAATAFQIANNNVDNLVGGIGINLGEGADPTYNGSILGNNIGVSGGSDACIQVRGDNVEIAGNHCGANAEEWSIIGIAGPAAVAVNTAGLKIADNYAADGIWLKSLSTCTGGAQGECHVTADCTGASSGTCDATKYGRFDHNLILGNVTARSGTNPNGGHDILVENQMSLVIGDNTILGNKSNVDAAGIYVKNTRSGDSNGNVVIGHNTIGIQDANSGGQSSCIIFDDAGGGGFDEWVIDGNTCGRQDYAASSGPASNFIKAVNSPSPWTEMSVTDNNAGQVATFISSDPGGTLYCGNQGKADTCGGALTTTIVKANDETINGTAIDGAALQDDNDFTLSLEANKTYALDGVLLVAQASGTAADFKFNFVEQTGTTFRIMFSVAGVNTSGETGHHLQSDTDSGQIDLVADTEQVILIKGSVFVGGTAGTFKLQWAQNTDTNVDTTVYKGSWLSFTKTN